jgi:3-phosphoshikimate 1-carboxyvinyltransferase
MSGHGDPVPMTARKGPPLKGTAQVPGDKSISHRSADPRRAGGGRDADHRPAGGAGRAGHRQRDARLRGRGEQHGPGGMDACTASASAASPSPRQVIDCGNSGTGVRLIMGAMATTPITATFTGDASLNGRPMARVTDPLALFGTKAVGRAGGRLPMTLVGAADPLPVRYTVPVPSAQVKSAVLLPGLNAPGETVVIEAEATRDHTERMLAGFGARSRPRSPRKAGSSR